MSQYVGVRAKRQDARTRWVSLASLNGPDQISSQLHNPASAAKLVLGADATHATHE